jgi:hypothetical protein
MRRLSVTCLSILAQLVAACSPVLQVVPAPLYAPEPTSVRAVEQDRHWWQLRFKLVWPEGEEPDFSRHLLIAEQLLLPVIVEYRAEMPLWRFHRRAGRSPSGHQFSLIFFSDNVTASRIDEAVESNPLTGWLIDNGLIEKILFGQRSPAQLGRLELASDPDWPIEVQRSWPYFIMGASQAWLMLVSEMSAESALDGKVDYPSLLEHYREVDERLNTQWRDYGQHAYLHHLNALFGYQPLLIKTKELRTF